MPQRISEEDLKGIKIPIPSPEQQDVIVAKFLERKREAGELRSQANNIEDEARSELFKTLKLKEVAEKPQKERVTYTRI